MLVGENRGRRWGRRLITIPVVVIAWSLFTALLPVAVPLLAVADLLVPPRRWARCRAVVALWWVLCCEVLGLIGAFWLWCVHVVRRDAGAFHDRNAALQRWWTETLFRGAVRIFGMGVTIEGGDATLPPPYLLFARHCSVVDTLLAAHVIANRHRIVFRYVLKQELLWDPCLDVVGGRLTNAFVARGRALHDADIEAVRALARDLGPSEGVLIFPEGTRFEPAKLARAVARLSERAAPDIVERAARLRHVMPPRPGGSLALIDTAPELDVVFFAHTGLERTTALRDFWRGGLIGTTIHVRIHRVPATDIPRDDAQRLAWLFDQWLDVDRWIESVR